MGITHTFGENSSTKSYPIQNQKNWYLCNHENKQKHDMKRIITLILAMTIAFATLAQRNVTKFLGIPIDGTKAAMIQKLKAKGFTYDAKKDIMTGEFNGHNVELHVVTNNNKVYRILVVDAIGYTEGEIKNRFNTLCRQFEKNGKYVPQNFTGEFEIGEKVDLSYEIDVNEKRFEAAYFQFTEADEDTTGMAKWAIDKVTEEYGLEKWQSMSEEEVQQAQFMLAMEYFMEKIAHKSVWFMISKS